VTLQILGVVAKAYGRQKLLDWLKNYLLRKIHKNLFHLYKRMYKKEDTNYKYKIMSLSNVTMEELGIKPKCIPDKNLLPIGYKVPINLLKTLSKKESPKEKYDTLVAVSDEIVKTVHKNLEILKIEAELGADDLFPIFLYVVIKSKLSYMYSEFKYLLDFFR
jgi:hypothetical protein